MKTCDIITIGASQMLITFSAVIIGAEWNIERETEPKYNTQRLRHHYIFYNM